MSVQDFDQLRARTKQFALRVIALIDSLPAGIIGRVLGDQLLRCSTSVGANYRAACRARSRADFISKIGIVEEEADESAYWLELLMESGKVKAVLLQPLHREAVELTAIMNRSRQTAQKSARRR